MRDAMEAAAMVAAMTVALGLVGWAMLTPDPVCGGCPAPTWEAR